MLWGLAPPPAGMTTSMVCSITLALMSSSRGWSLFAIITRAWRQRTKNSAGPPGHQVSLVLQKRAPSFGGARRAPARETGRSHPRCTRSRP